MAGVVGEVASNIMGRTKAETVTFAHRLGQAMQLTNIIRDVGVDLDNGGRVYLPTEDLERFGYTAADLRAHVHDKRFRALMKFEADRAEGFYRSAKAHLTAHDRRSMVAAELMRAVYHQLLLNMRADRYEVFAKRYRLGKVRKLWTLLTTALRTRFF